MCFFLLLSIRLFPRARWLSPCGRFSSSVFLPCFILLVRFAWAPANKHLFDLALCHPRVLMLAHSVFIRKNKRTPNAGRARRSMTFKKSQFMEESLLRA